MAKFKVGQRVTDGNRTFVVKKVFDKWQDLQSEFGSNFHRVSDGFKNRPGVYYKDDSGHIVHEKDITGAVNSALNAKFKVGDKVKVVDRMNLDVGKTGVITAYHGDGQYQISLDINGGLRGVSERQIVPNSVGNRSFACNDAYVDGMTAKDLDDALESLENIIDDGDVMPSDKRSLVAYKKAAVRLGKLRDWQYVAKRMGINSFSNSTSNPVVANALEWRAKNAVARNDLARLIRDMGVQAKNGNKSGALNIIKDFKGDIVAKKGQAAYDEIVRLIRDGKEIPRSLYGKFEPKTSRVPKDLKNIVRYDPKTDEFIDIKTGKPWKNSTNHLVANAVAWKAGNAVPTYVGRGIFKVDDVVEYSGSPWKVIAVSKLGIGNGMSKVSYGLKSVKTGVVVKDIPEHNISKV